MSKRLPLLDELKRLKAGRSAKAGPIRQLPIRGPRQVFDEIEEAARAHGVSANALIAAFIDAGLRDLGRPGVEELAPWAPSYYSRTRRGPAVLPLDVTEDLDLPIPSAPMSYKNK